MTNNDRVLLWAIWPAVALVGLLIGGALISHAIDSDVEVRKALIAVCAKSTAGCELKGF